MDAKKDWHIGNWPPLAWVETVLKLAGMAYGFMALWGSVRQGSFAIPGGDDFWQWLILVILSLGLVAAIYDRLQDKEIIAMGFVLLNNLAHWGMVLALAAGIKQYLVPFAALFLAGDMVKLIFIRVNQFTVRDFPQRVLYLLTTLYIVGYIFVLGLN